MDIKSVQLALKERGHDPGAPDGIWGRKSIAALKEFQKAAGLAPDGVIGPRTTAALFPKETAVRVPVGNAPVTAIDPVWYSELVRLKGLREGPGRANNPVIIDWAKGLGGWIGDFYKADSTPWCGLTIGHVIATTLPNEPLPNNPLGALEWAKFGVRLVEPALGAVLVFSRSGGGHVALYQGEDATHYICLGGNQGDAVSVMRIAKARCVAIRWPSTVTLPTTGRVKTTISGPVSQNEA